MKVNLTKLLESPTRVLRLKGKPEPDTAAYFLEREYKATSPHSTYAFELENDEFILEEGK